MRIALTGATGFVGKALLPLLLEHGHSVAALVRNPSIARFDERVGVVQGGLDSAVALDALTKSADVVLHVAGVVAGVHQQDFFGPNVDGTVALAHAALKNGVKHFVHVSSLAAREPDLNFYSASKAAAEFALQKLSTDMRMTVLRPAAVYGPGDTATLPLLKSLMSPFALIPGSPKARFAMVHVHDVARVLEDAAMQSSTGTFEIDDGSTGHQWPELLRITQTAFGLPRRTVFVPRNVAMTLGFFGDMLAQVRRKPALLGQGQLRQIYHDDWCVSGTRWSLQNAISLQQGLPETIRWYQAQGLLPLGKAADRRPHTIDTTG
jgi:nucleoside-diphosphate-sugar epimerase